MRYQRLIELVEDVIFNKNESATQNLIDYAENSISKSKTKKTVNWRNKRPEELITHSLVMELINIIEDIETIRGNYDSALEIIEGLMNGMQIVGICW